MADDKPTDDSDKNGQKAAAAVPDVAKLAAGAIAVITAVTAIIGGVTGGVARIARNSPLVLPWAVGLVFIAAGLALAASLRTAPATANSAKPGSPTPPEPGQSATPPPGDRQPTGQRRRDRIRGWWESPGRQGTLLLLSLIVFGIAAVIVATASSSSLATPDRPVVTAKWTPVGGKWVLSGTAKGSGLKTEDQLTIVVFRLVDNGAAKPPSPKPTLSSTATPSPWWTPPQHYVFPEGLVYEQRVGADIDGNASVNFEVPLPNGYDAMQVVATLGTSLECAVPTPAIKQIDMPKYSCLTLDAPDTPPMVTTLSGGG
jgi:hypothetical protein